MIAQFEVRGRIDARGRTIISKSVRQVLRIHCCAEIACVVSEDRVRVADVEDEADPVAESLIAFLARDMQQNPRESIVEFPEALIEHMTALTRGVIVNLNEKIDGPVAL